MPFGESSHNTPTSTLRRAMFRTILAALSVVACSLAGAQDLTLADVKAKNAVQLSAEDLMQLMPGA
jgi:hypothetical protein